MVYKKVLDQVPPDYYDKGISSNLFQWIWHTWKWYSLKGLLKGLSGEILDIGCADGTLTAKIDNFLPKANLTGVDLYQKTIKYARWKRPRINFVVADARKLPFADRTFDAIVCIETLEHIPSHWIAVGEIYRTLKKGGVFVIAQDTDNLVFRLIWFLWVKWKGKVWRGAHVGCLSPDKLEKLLRNNGFKILARKFSHLGLEVAFKAKKI